MSFRTGIFFKRTVLSLGLTLMMTSCLSEGGSSGSTEQSSTDQNSSMCTATVDYETILTAQAYFKNPKVNFHALENKKWLGDKLVFDQVDALDIDRIHLTAETLQIRFLYFPHRQAEFKNLGLSLNGYRGDIVQASAVDFQVIGHEDFSRSWKLKAQDLDDDDGQIAEIDYDQLKSKNKHNKSGKLSEKFIKHFDNKKYAVGKQKTQSQKNKGEDEYEFFGAQLIQANIRLEKFIFGGKFSATDIIQQAGSGSGRLVFKINAPHGLARVYSADLRLVGQAPGSCPPPPPPPDVTGQSNPKVQINETSVSGLTSQTSIQISFSSDQQVQFQCSLDQQSFANCSNPFIVSGLTDGVHNFSVKAFTSDGRISNPAEFNWSVDATAPELTFGLINPAETITSNNSISIEFSAIEPAQFSCQFDGGSWTSCQSPLSMSGLSDGSHTLYVKAQDLVGNEGTPISYSWQVKATLPSVSITSAIPAGQLINSANRFYTFTGDNGAVSYLCQLDNQISYNCDGSYQLTNLTEGAHQFSVVAVDILGQHSDAVTDSFTVDLTSPEVMILSVLPQANPTNATDIVINFASSESASISCSIDGAPEFNCKDQIQFSGLDEGAHHIQIRAVDLAGNISSGYATYDWTIDLTKPLMTLISVNPLGEFTNQTTMSLGFSSNETSSISCQLDQQTIQDCSLGTVYYSGLLTGTHNVSIISTDLAGNRSDTLNYSWTIDTIAPEVYLTNVDPSGVLTNSTNIGFGFNSTKLGDFQCQLDSSLYQSCSSPTSYSNLSDGSHQFLVRSIDLAGNISQPASYFWVVDTVTPVTTITSSTVANGETTSLTSMSIEFDSNESNSSFVCQLDGLGYQECTSPVTYSGLSDANHTVDILAIDAAGNISSSPATVSWTVDSTPIVISGFSVTNVTRNSLTLVWTTNKPTTSQGAFAILGGSYSFTSVNANLVTSHVVTITGLSASTQYNLYGISVDANGIKQTTSVLSAKTNR